MALSAVATTSMSSTTMNDATELSASTHRCAGVDRWGFPIVCMCSAGL